MDNNDVAVQDTSAPQIEAPAPKAPEPFVHTTPCRVKLEFGSRGQQQTHDIKPGERCGDLIESVGLKVGEHQVLAPSGEPLHPTEMGLDHFRPGQTVHIVQHPDHNPQHAVSQGPVMSGSGQHLL